MPIIRKQLKPSDVYPDNIRYNEVGDKVQVFIDGEWVDAPESDPRTQTTYPPRATADPRCDGAQSVADALENQIAQILTAIDNAQTLATIAGLVLGLLSFGVFAIFINIALAIAGYMLDAGTAAISATLPPTAFDQLACILYCHMDAQGRIKKGDLPNIYNDIVDEISLPGAQVLISMLELAGEGGLNNLASIGTATGDCDECPCADTWCYLFDFTLSDGDWTRYTAAGDNNGTYVAGQGWNTSDFLNLATTPDSANRLAYIKRAHPSTTITKVILTYNYTGGTFDSTALRALIIFLNGVDRGNITRAAIINGTGLTFTIEGEWTGIENIELYLRSSRDTSSPYTYSGSGRIVSVQMEGEGTNPFGVDTCTPP
jgi:hypothetical protein